MEQNSMYNAGIKIPFYKTRKFWIILLVSQTVLSLSLFWELLTLAKGFASGFFILINIFGSFMPSAIAGKLWGDIAEYVVNVAYLAALITTCMYLIKNKIVRPIYPLVISLIILSSMMGLFVYLSSLSNYT